MAARRSCDFFSKPAVPVFRARNSGGSRAGNRPNRRNEISGRKHGAGFLAGARGEEKGGEWIPSSRAERSEDPGPMTTKRREYDVHGFRLSRVRARPERQVIPPRT